MISSSGNARSPIFAAFPNVEGGREVVIAYDATGDEVGCFGETEQEAAMFTRPTPLQVDLSRAQFEELSELTQTSMRSCLADHGGTIGHGDVATFANEIDEVAVWNDCVSIVKQTVTECVATLKPRCFRPDGTTSAPDDG